MTSCWLLKFFFKTIFIQCYSIVSVVLLQLAWCQSVEIPPKAPLESQTLPLCWLCYVIILFISSCPFFVSWTKTISGFSWFIRSFKAFSLEGCPSPLLFHERTFIISNEGCEELLSLLGPCLLSPCQFVLRYRTIWGSRNPLLYLFGHSHLCVVLLIFFQASFGCQVWHHAT